MRVGTGRPSIDFNGYRQAPSTSAVTSGKAELRLGDSGEAVRLLQRSLGVTVDGKFGAQTLLALDAAKTQHGLTGQAGRAGATTFSKLVGADRFNASPTSSRVAARRTSSTGKLTGTGANRSFRGFVDVSTEKLKALLPPQAKGLATTFIEQARKYDLDPRFLVAISKFETGGWTSSAFKNKNNAMGVSNSRGPIAFDRPEQSIERMAKGLANPRGYYRNAKTIGQVGAIYAPVGAKNDPNGTNGHWPRSVGRFTDEFARQLP